MKKVIVKFYDKIFLDEDAKSEEVPYGNKLFMFWFSMISFMVVMFFIAKEVVKNIQA